MKLDVVRKVARRARDLTPRHISQDPVLRETVQAVSQAQAQSDVEVRMFCKDVFQFALAVRAVRSSLEILGVLAAPLQRHPVGVTFELRNGSAIVVIDPETTMLVGKAGAR